jgi:hypothetical protein
VSDEVPGVLIACCGNRTTRLIDVVERVNLDLVDSLARLHLAARRFVVTVQVREASPEMSGLLPRRRRERFHHPLNPAPRDVRDLWSSSSVLRLETVAAWLAGPDDRGRRAWVHAMGLDDLDVDES